MRDLTEANAAAIHNDDRNQPDTPDVIDEFTVDELSEEVAACDVGDLPHSDEERRILQYLRRRGQVLAELDHVQEQTASMIRSLQSKVKGLDYVFQSHARTFAQQQLAGKKAKSIKTPFGTMGFHTSPAILEIVSEDQVMEAVALGELPAACVRQPAPQVAKAALNDVFKSTGEIPPGCKIVGPSEHFYVK